MLVKTDKDSIINRNQKYKIQKNLQIKNIFMNKIMQIINNCTYKLT